MESGRGRGRGPARPLILSLLNLPATTTMANSSNAKEGRSALEDTLGEWLNGNHQAELQAYHHQAQTANNARQVYRDMWEDAEDMARDNERMYRQQLRARDELINMLYRTFYELHWTPGRETDTSFTREPVLHNMINALRNEALQQVQFRNFLDDPYTMVMESREAVERELGNEANPIDLTTDEDTDEE